MPSLDRRDPGIYISCEYDRDSLIPLIEWMKDHNIPCPVIPGQIHTTILYSKTPVKGIPPIEFSNWEIEPAEFDLFPLSHTDESEVKALVIKLSSPELIATHQELIERGGSHDFPEYHPHLTLSYNVPADFDLSTLTLPDVKLRPKAVYIKPLDKNWACNL